MKEGHNQKCGPAYLHIHDRALWSSTSRRTANTLTYELYYTITSLSYLVSNGLLCNIIMATDNSYSFIFPPKNDNP